MSVYSSSSELDFRPSNDIEWGPPPRATREDFSPDISIQKPAEDPSDEEINAEVTKGGWRCHLKRTVKTVNSQGDTVEYVHTRKRYETPRTLSEAFSRFGEPSSVVDQFVKSGLQAEPELVSDPELRREVDSIYHLYRVPKNRAGPHGLRLPYSQFERGDELREGPQFHLEIRSPLVVKLLRNLVVYYPGQMLDGSTITVPEPYMLLWHHHRALRKYLDDPSSGEDTRKHLQVLIRFLDSNEADAMEFKNFDAAQKGAGKISFRNAWYLYRPGNRLLKRTPSRSLSLSSLCIVESVTAAQRIPSSSTPRFGKMMLFGRDISYNGMAFHWITVSLTIHRRNWPANTQDLLLLPMEHLVNQEEVSRSLRERGLRYWHMQGQQLKEYVGNKPEDAPDVSSLLLLRECQRVASSHIPCRNYQIAKTRQGWHFKLNSSSRSLH